MNAAPFISPTLVKKYASNLPRYTSYPTAPWFDSDFDSEDYKGFARRSNESLLPRPLSIYVHIPFCHSLCYFCGCNKVITQPNAHKVNTYIDALLAEIRSRAALFDDDRLVQQIHFGGGTPNFLSANQLQEILEEIAQCFHLALPSKLEVGIELDPRYLDCKGVEALVNVGFNRFSVGVQDFAENVQRAINRLQNEQQTMEVIQTASSLSDSVNIDIITGLPGQDEISIRNTIEKIIESGASRIAAYGFAYLPDRIKAQKLIPSDQVLSDEQRLSLSHLVSELLMEAGYKHVGMDHYTLPEDKLYQSLQQGSLQRNFQGYTTHAETDLIGLGVSAISNFEAAFAQNTTSLPEYIRGASDGRIPIVKGLSLSSDDLLRKHMIQELMCQGKIDLSQSVDTVAGEMAPEPMSHYFAELVPYLDEFVTDGILTKNSSAYTLTEVGRFFMRPVAAKFDAYLNCGPNADKRIAKFSRAL